MSVLWIFVIAASSVLGLVAYRLYPRRPDGSDTQAVYGVFAVSRENLEAFRVQHPHLLTIEECLRWMTIRGFDRFQSRLLVQVRSQQKANPDAKLLCHFAAVTKYGYVSSGKV